MAIKQSDLNAALRASCDPLRGGIAARDADAPPRRAGRLLAGVARCAHRLLPADGCVGNVMLKLLLADLKPAILGHAEFQTFNQSATKCLADWRMKVNKQMGVAWI